MSRQLTSPNPGTQADGSGGVPEPLPTHQNGCPGRGWWTFCALFTWLFFCPAMASAQVPGPPVFAPVPAPPPVTAPAVPLPPPPRIRDFSWIYVEAPPPPAQIKVHDIVTIEVDEKAEVIVNSRFNRQRNGTFKAQLKDFVKIVSGPKLIDSASDQPTIEGSLQNRLQTIGQGTDSEGITYKIAATVVDVLPNGTIVLEARKSVRSNQDFFEYRLTGRLDKGKIKPDRTARTEDIAELRIERIQKGKIFDSTKVNWGTRILDIIWPF